MQTRIADVLQRFNRKERYWVVRNALGAPARRLSRDFCSRVQMAFGDSIERIDPDDVWWALDYHFDWLFAALSVYRSGDHGLFHAQPNGSTAHKSNRPVQGQQEDIDLVLASGSDLILVEVKAFGAWNTNQFNSKVNRLKYLTDDPRGAVAKDDNSTGGPVRLHFALMSRTPPSHLKPSADTPGWVLSKSGAPYWLQLDVASEPPDLRVGLCNEAHGASRGGDHWRLWWLNKPE